MSYIVGGLKRVVFRAHVILLHNYMRNSTVTAEDLMPITVAASGTNYWTKLLENLSIGIPGLLLLYLYSPNARHDSETYHDTPSSSMPLPLSRDSFCYLFLPQRTQATRTASGAVVFASAPPMYASVTSVTVALPPAIN